MTRRTRSAAALFLAPALIAAVPLACRRGGGGPPMTFVEARMADLPAQVLATGTVTPQVGAQVKVGPRVSGKLEHLYVKVGDLVEKGQVLAVVESRDLEAGVIRSEAALRDSQASLVYAEATFARQEALVRDGIISADQLDVARKALESARAQVKSARAALDQSKIQLSYATVTAPIRGTVASVATQEGETVAAQLSAPTFVTLVDLGRLEVDAYVDEVDIGRVQAGQSATFTVDAYPDKVFGGVVEAIYPQAVIQDNVVNYPVIVRVEGERPQAPGGPEGAGQEGRGGTRRPERPRGGDGTGRGSEPARGGNAQGLLRPQMTASVTLLLDTLRGVLVIPVRAVKRENGQTYVLVKEGDKTVRRPVTLGREAGEVVQVKAGVSRGDQVAVPQARGEGMP